MDIKCRCNQDCIKKPPVVLEEIEYIYLPCDNCPDWNFRKFKPFLGQIDLSDNVDENWGRCSCGRRHLDVVVGHVLRIMQLEGIKDEKATLREACVPLITPAFPLNNVPHLLPDTLVILSPDVDEQCAKRIVKEVPEVKGVLKGDIKDTVGIRDNNTSNLYELLAGCDMRCDLVQTRAGPICIYKPQGEIHVEFPKPVSPKISALSKVMSQYENPKILDCTCGPGTLGIAALKAGASRVVFNDLWYPAAYATSLNLEVNGYPVELSDKKEGLISHGTSWDVYCLDVKDLASSLEEKFHIGVVDTFPGMDTTIFTRAIKDLCQEVIVI
ncbi:MAG: hypothetical protein PWQ15_1425 [Methanobacterium sp.]|jgi:hypothetical protein|uniref:50S ribosomal protein L11 methyltransferase n=1 Tax=Methanobacterium sp. TaxID=2164 RepID=UPI0003C938F3|nr:50S ribosomal protein L11 methyltransferase [Methanobacterium sp.]MDI3550322.1 hypothetical protein [Methanobacterium sp.]CDG65660.1 hypothetical protein MBMB1_1568 [Methanobacterium sp. MB1]